MIYTVTNMESLIRSEMNETSQQAFTSAEILKAINDGCRDVAYKGMCIESEYTENTVVGCNLIDVGDKLIKYIESSGKGLMKITPAMIGHAKLDGVSPQFWFQWGRLVYIEPIPTTAVTLTIRYYDSPAELFEGIDIPDIPEPLQPAIVYYAMFLLYLKLKKWGNAHRAYNVYAEMIMRCRRLYVDQEADGRFEHEIPTSIKERRVGGQGS